MEPKKRYRSALRSERLLREAYVTLAEQGNKISVSSLCREADLNRSTFYVHYDSIEALETDLVGRFMTDLGATVARTVQPDFKQDPTPVINAIGSYVAQNRTLIRLLLTSTGSFGFGDDLRRTLLEVVGSSCVEDEVRFDYVAGGLASIYRTWVVGQYGDLTIEKTNQLVAEFVRTS